MAKKENSNKPAPRKLPSPKEVKSKVMKAVKKTEAQIKKRIVSTDGGFMKF